MKRKYDQFMEDMNLREEAWAYEKAEFDKQIHYADGLAKGLAEGLTEGETKKSKSQAIKFYQKKYPESDIQWLEDLTEYQYDQIFKKLIEDASLEEIKKIIGD